jgi:hypothetical protein
MIESSIEESIRITDGISNFNSIFLEKKNIQSRNKKNDQIYFFIGFLFYDIKFDFPFFKDVFWILVRKQRLKLFKVGFKLHFNKTQKEKKSGVDLQEILFIHEKKRGLHKSQLFELHQMPFELDQGIEGNCFRLDCIGYE